MTPLQYLHYKLQLSLHPPPWGIALDWLPFRSGQRPACGDNSHIQRVPRTQSYSNHLLVLHNTCHCLPLHQQICTPLSHRRISPELSHAAKVLVTTLSANSLPGRLNTSPLGCWCKMTSVSTHSVNWDFSQMDFSQNVTSDNPWGRVWPKDLFWKWTTNCGQVLTRQPTKGRVLKALLAWSNHRKVCFIV